MKEDPNDIAGNPEQQAARIAYLVAGFLQQKLTEPEHDELDEWITASDENQRLFEQLIDPQQIKEGMAQRGTVDTEAALKRIQTKLATTQPAIAKQRAMWYRYAVAASVILLAGIAITYQYMKQETKKNNVTAISETLQPGGNHATLTLSNGRAINLSEAKNGLLDTINGSDVLKTADGQLSYESSEAIADKGEQHILSTPSGGQYSVTLPDGSRVWLNAASSLKYPVVFNDKERVVELSGEGYFEISPLLTSPGGGGTGKTPFIVKVDGMEVEVLGTHFNVNAYTDEAGIATTLLEGKIKVGSWQLAVDSKQPEIILNPGEQAKRDDKGNIIVNKNVNTESIVAWKNGEFEFKDEPIESIMRQVARWYDATIVYKGKVDYHFNATINRKEPVSKLLELLAKTKRVQFSITDKTIIVSP